VSLGVLWFIGGMRLVVLVFQVMEYSLEEGEFGWELGQCRGDAIDDVGDGSAVRVDGVILLLW
jgi:hypothetical protein